LSGLFALVIDKRRSRNNANSIAVTPIEKPEAI